MKRRIVSYFVVCILTLCALFSITACGGSGGHKHAYNDTIVAPTCTEEGYTKHVCKCGDEKIDTYVDMIDHKYVNNRCQMCHQKKPTDGISFSLSTDGSFYGVCFNQSHLQGVEELVVPSTYNGKPVKGLGDFYGLYLPDSVKKIEIPNTITSFMCFFGGTNLTYNVKNGIKYIGNEKNPYYCMVDFPSDVPSVVIDNNCKMVADSVLHQIYYSTQIQITQFNVKDGLRYIGKEGNPYYILVGMENEELVNVEIADGCEIIGSNVFSWEMSIQTLSIPSSMKKMSYGNSLSETFVKTNFEGTIEQWAQINFEASFNDPFQPRAFVPHGASQDLYINNELVTKINIQNPTRINSYAFAQLKSLTEVVLGDSVEYLGDFAFGWCENLKDVTLSDNLKGVGISAFYDCSNVNYNVKNGSNYIGSEQNDYLYLDTFVAQEPTTVSIDEKCRIVGLDAFYNVLPLDELIVPDSVEYLAFFDITCDKLVIGKGLKVFIDYESDIGKVYYNGTADDFVKIEFPLYNIYGSGLVADELYIDSQLVSEVVLNETKDIRKASFSINSSITSVVIGDSVETIDENAFMYCQNLSSVTIGKGVKSIGDGVFSICDKLDFINYTGTIEEWNKIIGWQNLDVDYVQCSDGQVSISAE